MYQLHWLNHIFCSLNLIIWTNHQTSISFHQPITTPSGIQTIPRSFDLFVKTPPKKTLQPPIFSSSCFSSPPDQLCYLPFLQRLRSFGTVYHKLHIIFSENAFMSCIALTPRPSPYSHVPCKPRKDSIIPHLVWQAFVLWIQNL